VPIQSRCHTSPIKRAASLPLCLRQRYLPFFFFPSHTSLSLSLSLTSPLYIAFCSSHPLSLLSLWLITSNPLLIASPLPLPSLSSLSLRFSSLFFPLFSLYLTPFPLSLKPRLPALGDRAKTITEPCLSPFPRRASTSRHPPPPPPPLPPRPTPVIPSAPPAAPATVSHWASRRSPTRSQPPPHSPPRPLLLPQPSGVLRSSSPWVPSIPANSGDPPSLLHFLMANPHINMSMCSYRIYKQLRWSDTHVIWLYFLIVEQGSQ